jgi:hypothetical protein|tara:strand:+ start:2546 stop:3406 length:861 start_codon:yes stop_codon:yes gene_type:complete
MAMKIDKVDNILSNIYIDRILDNNISILEIYDEDSYSNKVDNMIQEQHNFYNNYIENKYISDVDNKNKLIELFIKSLYLETDIYCQHIDIVNFNDIFNKIKNNINKNLKDIYDIINDGNNIKILYDIFSDIYHYPVKIEINEDGIESYEDEDSGKIIKFDNYIIKLFNYEDQKLITPIIEVKESTTQNINTNKKRKVKSDKLSSQVTPMVIESDKNEENNYNGDNIYKEPRSNNETRYKRQKNGGGKQTKKNKSKIKNRIKLLKIKQMKGKKSRKKSRNKTKKIRK